MATTTPALASAAYKGQIRSIATLKKNSVVLLGDSRTAQCGKPITFTSITRSGTTATATFSGHDVIEGQDIYIGGATDPLYNGLFTVTASTANTFDYEMTSTPAANAVASGGGLYGTTPLRHVDTGYFNWMNAQLGARFEVIANLGLGGDTVANMAARTDEVISLRPQYCFHMGFINSANGGQTAAQIIADLTTIYTDLLAAGIIVVATTDIPLGTGATGYTAAIAKVVLIVNNWIRNYARDTAGMLLLDVHQVVVDGTSTTGQPLANMLWASDGLHLTPKGARAVGNAGYDLFNTLVPASNTLANNQADDSTTDANNPNVVLNGMMQGTGGTLGGVASGVVADNWSITSSTLATLVGSVVARADGFGNNQRVVATSNSSGDFLQIYTTGSLNGSFSAGDTVYFEADISITSATNLAGTYWRIQTAIDGVSVNVSSMETTIEDNYDNTDMSNFVFRSTPFTYPAGSTITSTFLWFQVYFSGVGGATVDVGRVVLRKS